MSVTTLAAIARGLRLSQAERSYLFELAARADPSPRRAAPADPLEMMRLVKTMRTPAYVLDRHWDPIAWNRPATLLFQGWLNTRARPSNLLRYVFLEPASRRFIVDWTERSRRLVAEYRADTAAWQEDPVRRALVQELSDTSREFAAAWSSQTVLRRDGGTRRFEHPRNGKCSYLQHTLRPASQPELKVVVLTQD